MSRHGNSDEIIIAKRPVIGATKNYNLHFQMY